MSAAHWKLLAPADMQKRDFKINKLIKYMPTVTILEHSPEYGR
jgi:hypothetical protein